MSDLSKMGQVAIKLEALGAKHAPLQHLEGTDTVDGRYVTLRDPPGVYYLLGTDNRPRETQTYEVQLLFVGTAPDPRQYAAALRYCVDREELLPGSTPAVPVHSVIMSPP